MGDGRTPLIGSDARTPAPGTPPCTMTGTETGRQQRWRPVLFMERGPPPPRFPQNADRPFRIMEENGRSVMV